MKPLPSDPFAFQARVMAAFNADLSDLAAFKRDGFARTNALRAVSIATNQRAEMDVAFAEEGE